MQDARRSSAGGDRSSPRAPTWEGNGGGWPHRAAAVAVVVVGALLRLLYLDQPIRYDEAVTYLRYVTLPLPEALTAYDLPNNHVFHTLLAHLSVEAFGDAPAVLRLPAWAAGTLVVPATYLVGRTVARPRTGLLAAALAAASPVLILFSVNARGYSLMALAFLALASTAAVMARRWSFPAWAVFVAAAALGAWTLPAMIYPAVAAAAWWIAAAARGERSLTLTAAEVVGAGLAAAGLAALLYVPVFREYGVDAVVANRFVAPRPLEPFVSAVPGFLADVAREWSHGVPAWAAALVAAGAVAEGVAWASGRRSGPPPLFPVCLAASLLVLAASRRTPFARVWLFLLPALLIFAASGLVRVAEGVTARVRGAAAGSRRTALAAACLPPVLAVVLGVAVVRSDVVGEWGLTGSLPSGDRVADFVARRWEPGDVVFAHIPSDGPLKYYFRRRGLPLEAVNEAPEPGGCVFVVVNRRHGQRLPDVARSPEPGRTHRLLRSWEEVAVYGRRSSPAGDREAGEGVGRPCGPDGRSGRWRPRRRSDRFAAIGLPAGRTAGGRGERAGNRQTTETPGLQ